MYSRVMGFIWGLLCVLIVGMGCGRADNRGVATRDSGCAGCEPSYPHFPRYSNKPASIRIVILGDRTGRPDDSLFLATIREASRLKPDLIVSAGDLIDGYQEDERIHEAAAEWERVLKMLRSAFGDIPLFVTAGNHDVWSERSEALFEETLGHPVNHSFNVGPVRFIMFDSSRTRNEGEVEEEDLDWLVRELGEARGSDQRVVMTHVPMWAIDGGGAYGSPLHDVLIAGNANWVITGHWHHAMSDQRDGIKYRIIGPTGTLPHRPGHPESGNVVQFGFMTLSPEGVEFSLIPSGSILSSTAFPYEYNQLEWKIQERALRVEGFELSGYPPVPKGVATLYLENVTDEEIVGPMIIRNGEAGWRVRPNRFDLRLGPGQIGEYRVRYGIPPGGALFPGPTAEVSVPWIGGGSYRLKKELRPILKARLPRMEREPVVDGLLEESLWKSALRLWPLHVTEGAEGEIKSDVRVAMAGGKLWVGFHIEDPDMGGQYLGKGELLDDYGQEDMAAVFIDLNPEDPVYGRVVIGASGRAAGHLFGQKSKQGPNRISLVEGENYQVVRDGKSWRVELALAPQHVGFTGDGEARVSPIGFNAGVVRARNRMLTRAMWQPFGENDEPSFGKLVLRLGQSQTIRP